MSAVRFSDGATVEDLARTAHELQEQRVKDAAEIERLRAAMRRALDEIEHAGPKALKYAAQELSAALGEDGRAPS